MEVLVKRREPIETKEGPIIVCTRNDVLHAVLKRTPEDRRKDLVFIQNGMLQPWLDTNGLKYCTQALVYFAVAKLGEPPVDGKTRTNPDGLTAVHGPHAQAFKDLLSSGDLGKRVPVGNQMSGQFILTGRSKDNITLMDGVNVAPQPIEDELCRSPLLAHVMLVGQDKRTLSALVCLSTDELERRMKEGGDERAASELSSTELDSVALAEVSKLSRRRAGMEGFEAISVAAVLPHPFSVGDGTLTQTLKLRRGTVRTLYAKEISALLDRMR